MKKEEQHSYIIRCIEAKFKKVLKNSFNIIGDNLKEEIFIISEENKNLKEKGYKTLEKLNKENNKILSGLLGIYDYNKEHTIIHKDIAHSEIGHYLIVIRWDKPKIEDKYCRCIIEEIIECIIEECKNHIKLDARGYSRFLSNSDMCLQSGNEIDIDGYAKYCEEEDRFADYNKKIKYILIKYCEYILTGEEKDTSSGCYTIDYLNSISRTPYESSYSKGKLAIFKKNSEVIKYFSEENTKGLKNESIIKFKRYEYLQNEKAARKLIEMSNDDYLVISDGVKIYGMISKDVEEDKIIVKFNGNYSYEIQTEDRKIIRLEYGYPHKSKDIDEQELRIRIKRVFGDEIQTEDIEHLVEIINHIKLQSKGSMLVISNQSDNEVERLKYQSTLIEPKALYLDSKIVENISRIDGSIFVDVKGNCKAIGVILDGIACEIGNRSRGARYNSAIKYINEQIEKNNKHNCMAIVISEDKMIDIIDKEEIYKIKDREKKIENQKKIEDKKMKNYNTIAKYDKLIELEEKSEYYSSRGYAYRIVGNYEKAIEDYSKAIELEEKAMYYNNRGVVHHNKEEYKKAIEDYSKAIELEEKATCYNNRGNAYSIVENYSEAIEDYSKAIELEERATYYNNRGMVHYNKKNYNKAIEDYSKAIKLEEDATYYNNRGDTYYRKEEYEKAIEDYSKAIELEEKATYYNDRGDTYYNKEEYEKAIEDYSKAIELEENPTYYNNRGVSRYNREEYEKAIEDYSRAIELEEDATYYSNRGDAHKNIGNYEKAIEDYSKAIELEEKATYYNDRGDTYYNKEEYEKAIEDYSRAIELEEDATYYSNRGDAHKN
ncbi:MAG: tetratricopeptide repeat protein, partial [Paraclostridium sp.]|uniref:tetratricopeptide repeat protein n=1 Tax=Paraclostridium sp. TaxID=2023273 RepID=UPI003F35C48F